MRFECGKNYKNLQQWHEWFAWYPVHMNGQCIWLETIERRMTGIFYLDIEWEYRETTGVHCNQDCNQGRNCTCRKKTEKTLNNDL